MEHNQYAQHSIQENANGQISSSEEKTEIIKRIENSPFVLVQADNGYFVGIGTARLTDYYDTREDIEKIMQTWDFYFSVLSYICRYQIQIYNNEQHQPGKGQPDNSVEPGTNQDGN